jgi:hypothetical protein
MRKGALNIRIRRQFLAVTIKQCPRFTENSLLNRFPVIHTELIKILINQIEISLGTFFWPTTVASEAPSGSPMRAAHSASREIVESRNYRVGELARCSTLRENEQESVNVRRAGSSASVGAFEGKDSPNDDIGNADATNEWIGGLGLGFGHSRHHGGKTSKNFEYLRCQREMGDRDAGHLRLQFVIVIQKHDIGNISGTEGRLAARH